MLHISVSVHGNRQLKSIIYHSVVGLSKILQIRKLCLSHTRAKNLNILNKYLQNFSRSSYFGFHVSP